MTKILRYCEIINEASMDYTYGEDPRKSLLLFSDSVRKDHNANGRKFTIFYDFYNEEYENIFFGLRLIDYEPDFRKNLRDYRFTLLTIGSYKDTDELGRRNLPYDPVRGKISVRSLLHIRNRNNYYFYDLVYGQRQANDPPKPEHIEGEGFPDFEMRKRWIFLIEKNKTCNVIKSKARQEGGKWLEHLINKQYSWELKSHDIRLSIKNGDSYLRENGLIKQIFQTPDAEEGETFSIEDTEQTKGTFIKYDLIIDNRYKIETKKLSKNREKDLWNDGKSKRYMLAEQAKIADRKSLKKLVGWYNEIFEHDQRSWEYKKSKELLNLEERELAEEFSLTNSRDTYLEICNEIRDYYNKQTVRLLKVLNKIPKERWMASVYGIYFGSQDRFDRRWDFVVKIGDGIFYQWKFINEWLGFKRLKLFMYISGDSWEYLISEGNTFVKAFQLKDWQLHEQERRNGLITVDDGSQYRYNNQTKYWERI